MPQVSKYPVSQPVYERMFDLLMELFTVSLHKKEAEALLTELFTPTEKVMVAKRLATAVLLAKKYSYQDIQLVLHVSRSTIAHVNSSLKYGGNGYIAFTNKILKEEKVEKLSSQIDDVVLNGCLLEKEADFRRLYIEKLKNEERRLLYSPVVRTIRLLGSWLLPIRFSRI
ncbi:MAG: TrpR-like protein [Microgenomates group bacterium GW2011_GWC1_41_8]|uniref:TrpR like protein, YerC/YecD n=3 Tax=Candidatus Roizmaniibacteriota TaxID=1752723 RepID=A0A0G0XEL3_9BACT|nr:MAG: TrpR like protein, YerC/YecD [Candidatus Levybacteria bacterium GW2011_GWA2_40_16]KKR72597.1 MAG: TrpR like protein, YerC/YecD [Candidatus Roizmanbacteria bacterium GW2011_GWB1_40_7]KKR95038.1 MAG: TrpR like protein, YerC/YecD [Candidatus Roizmanbacteria bacterium GW2011_GWA1_41_13]KKS22892.1 MAG: TrpR like protein, YerC/YecD [Candidatus Roizmanbacteria bacterium GW2011_GWC2_41_7]KKS24792.1 MAG: TrpR-like protein [Microgenomates group bacterium GW2011_GWC1_41_8]OGK49078.1 MAG: hypothet